MPASEIAHLNVLVVEDVRATRVIVRAILRSFGIHEVVEAADGQEALMVLGQRHIDVVITDLCMEPMDGVEFTRRLRAPRNGLNPYVPVLMVSAHTDIAHVKDAIAAGVTEFLAKPIIPASLESRLLAIVRAPKKRISSKNYCGPDRRRSNRGGGKGPQRRASDKAGTPAS
jgi:two-component system, chemotaxis family, chemotaxis protein CheY